MSRPKVTIFTDGGCHPNPGPGGWGAIILGPGEEPVELSGGDPASTNNRMELTAAIKALEALPEPSDVKLVTDSSYLKDGITKWIDSWRQRGWLTAAKEPVKNRDLWTALVTAGERHAIRWRWTRGHSGHRWNERAHELAADACQKAEAPAVDPAATRIFLGVSYSGKRKIGAWGAVLRWRDHEKELSGRLDGVSANATHIASATLALEALQRPVPVELYTVSDYLRDGATRWLPAWRRRGWTTRDDTPVASRDWWERLGAQLDRLEIRWHVPGKEEVPEEIERAKELARGALAA